MNKSYNILTEHAISLEKVYIIDLDVKSADNDFQCAISRSDDICEILHSSQSELKSVVQLKGHKESITSIRFNPAHSDVALTSSLDGSVKRWDCRIGKCISELKPPDVKPLTCVDISAQGRVVCAGTEAIEGDSFLLFWDERSDKLLGAYWESHTDDITDLAFHPKEVDTLASASTDGLLNLFDLHETTEDDALQSSLNTGISIARCRWLDSDSLCVKTDTETVQVWNRDRVEPEWTYERQKIAEACGFETDDCYLVDVYPGPDGGVSILTGSYKENANALKLLTSDDGALKVAATLVGNRQIIRTSHLLQNGSLITAGEGGYLTWWVEGTESNSSRHKELKKRVKEKSKPY